MKRQDLWVRVPFEPAPPWAKLDIYTQMVAEHLYKSMGGDGVCEGSVEDAIAGALRYRGVDGPNRQRFKLAFERIQAAGLLFPHEGKAVLAYSTATWKKHREMVEGRAVEVPPRTRRRRVVSECSTSARECSASGHDVLASAGDATKPNHSDPVSPSFKRKRLKREREESVASGVFPIAQLELVASPPLAADAAKPRGVKKARAKPPKDERAELFVRVFREVSAGRNTIPPAINRYERANALERIEDFAKVRGLDLEQALREFFTGCYQRVENGLSSEMRYALLDWTPTIAPLRGVVAPARPEEYAASSSLRARAGMSEEELDAIFDLRAGAAE